MRSPHRACSYGATRRPTRAVGQTSLTSWCGAVPATGGLQGSFTTRLPGSPRDALAGRPLRGAVRSPAQLAADASTLLLYVMDVYDPWAYAYLPSVSEVLREARSVVGIEIVHAGRYAAHGAGALAASVGEVRRHSDVEFGSPFLDALASSTFRLDSEAAAAGVIAMMASGDLPVSTVLGAVQREFFVHGQPLEAPGTLARVAGRLGLDAAAIELFATSPSAHALALEDFAVARELDLEGGPVLLASRGDRLFEFDGLGATGERLVDQFRTVLAKP